ncbi:MAG: DUF4911 domain-containing protein [Desulfuromonadales bacterium]|nr:MAG: DUF4911 domain-containing protein [Desulfuromonadales bacterium]
MITRLYQVARSELAYLQFIIESYEGIAIMSTVDRASGTVSISCPAPFSADVAELIASLGTEIAIREIAERDTQRHA